MHLADHQRQVYWLLMLLQSRIYRSNPTNPTKLRISRRRLCISVRPPYLGTRAMFSVSWSKLARAQRNGTAGSEDFADASIPLWAVLQSM